MGYELEDEIWEVFKSREVAKSRQGCTGKSFSFGSRIPSDTTFESYSACPNGNQNKKLKTGSLWNYFWLREQNIAWYFPFGKRHLEPHHLEWVRVRDIWTPWVKSADNGCEESTFPFGRARHATQRRVLCRVGRRLPKTLPGASQGATTTAWQQHFITEAMWQPAGILKWPFTETSLKSCSGLPSVGETGYCWYGKLEKMQAFTFKIRQGKWTIITLKWACEDVRIPGGHVIFLNQGNNLLKNSCLGFFYWSLVSLR